MLGLLGLDEEPEPEVCYRAVDDRIVPEYYPQVQEVVEQMISHSVRRYNTPGDIRNGEGSMSAAAVYRMTAIKRESGCGVITRISQTPSG